MYASFLLMYLFPALVIRFLGKRFLDWNEPWLLSFLLGFGVLTAGQYLLSFIITSIGGLHATRNLVLTQGVLWGYFYLIATFSNSEKELSFSRKFIFSVLSVLAFYAGTFILGALKTASIK